jgi:hypothetical protein
VEDSSRYLNVFIEDTNEACDGAVERFHSSYVFALSIPSLDEAVAMACVDFIFF